MPTESRLHERFFLMCKHCEQPLLEWGPVFASLPVIEVLQNKTRCLCGGKLEIRLLLLDRPRTAYTYSDLQSMLKATSSRLSAKWLNQWAYDGADGSEIPSTST